MTDRDSLTIEFELSPSSVSNVKRGRPPGRGAIEITTADETERYCLTLFTYSVEQFLEAVPELLWGGRGGISTEDTTYIVLEVTEKNRGHVTLCFSRDAVSNPNRRLLPRDERPLDAVVSLPVLVDEVITAVAKLLERLERINEGVHECEWYRDLTTELDEVRHVAGDRFQ